ncbi:MAG: MFS transporter [Actinomycetota bacterium]
MTITSDARSGEVVSVPEARRGALRTPAALVLVILVLLLAFGWTFLRDPSITAPTRDPAWYTWRSNLMLHDDPGLIAGDWGPFHMFGGGYRVSVPLYGSILQRVAGIDLYTFSAMMMIAIPILTGMALGVFAYRVHRDRLLFLLVVLGTAALFMTTPYVGYLDNITVLFVLSMVLAFWAYARTSWGARVAMFLLGIVAAYTHPTTCVVFGASLMAMFALHFVTSRFSLGAALKRDGPALMSVGFGIVFGLGSWLVSPWGVKGSLSDAALPPPYTKAVFLKRLVGWVGSLQPLITIPLILLAIGWVIWQSRRDRQPASEFGTVSAAWLLPLLGAFGWITGAAYPYYRFMNATAGLMALTGLGTWVAVRWLTTGRDGWLKVAGVLASVAVVASLAFVWVQGREASGWAKSQWIDQPTRTALTAVDAVVRNSPSDSPVIFVVNYQDTYQAYGWSKTFTNVSRTGLPGDAVKRSMTYFGSVQDLLANRPTVGTDPTYSKMSRGFFHEVEALRRRYTGPPLVFLIRNFNEGTDNAAMLDQSPTPAGLIKISDDVAVVTGSTFATPSPAAIDAATRAEAQTAALYANHPGIFGNIGHTLWVLFALALLIVVPGLIASRFFELEDAWVRIALIPGLSFGLTVFAGLIVVAVLRSPFSTADGWATLGLATVFAIGLRFGEPAIRRALNGFSSFFNGMFSVFSNVDFATLMGVQFLAQAGQGVVQGAIAKSLAFGGEKGFDVQNLPSATYLLTVVLFLYGPYTLLSPFVGVLIDRFPRRRVVWWAAVITAVIVAAVAAFVLIPLGSGTTEGNAGATAGLIVGLLAVQAFVRVVLAVKSAAIPDVLTGRDLLQGNGLSQAGGAFFQVFGIGIGGVMAGLFPPFLAVLFGAAVVIAVAIVAMRLRHAEASPHESSFVREASQVVRNIVAGLKEVAARPAAALGLASFQMLRYQFWGFVLFVFGLYAKNLVKGGSADTLSLVLTGAGGLFGGVLGMILAQRWKDRVPPIRLLLGSMILVGAASFVFGAWVSLPGFSMLLFCGFFGFFLGKISADTIMQQAMPDDFRGRAFALFDIAYNLGFIVPALVLVLLWTNGRVRPLLMGSGLVFLVLTALITRWASSIRDQFATDDDTVPV